MLPNRGCPDAACGTPPRTRLSFSSMWGNWNSITTTSRKAALIKSHAKKHVAMVQDSKSWYSLCLQTPSPPFPQQKQPGMFLIIRMQSNSWQIQLAHKCCGKIIVSGDTASTAGAAPTTLKRVPKDCMPPFEIPDMYMKSVVPGYRDFQMLEQVTLLALRRISTLVLILVKTPTKGMTSLRDRSDCLSCCIQTEAQWDMLASFAPQLLLLNVTKWEA